MKKTYLRAIAKKAGDGIFSVLASTNAIDRQGDSVQQDGWDLENFKKNPVILWAHNYDELPIGKATELGVTVRGLEITFEFAPAEANPKAAQVRKLMEEGFLNAVSVGFIPKERNGNIITRQELLELSVVPVPANQEALRLAMSKGLDVSAIAKDIEDASEEPVAEPVEPVEEAPAEPVVEVPAEEVEEKAGRTLSASTLKQITKARDAISGAVAALDELLLSEASKSSHEDNGNDPEKVSVDKDLLKLFRSQLRANDRGTEAALTAIGSLLKSKGADSI